MPYRADSYVRIFYANIVSSVEKYKNPSFIDCEKKEYLQVMHA